MLSDKQKEQLSAEIIPLFQDLEQEVIQDIARRVRKEKRWTETAELQAKALEELGYSPSEIRAAVLKKLHANKEYIDMINKNTLEHKRTVKEEIDRVVAEAKKNGDDIVSRAGDMAFADDLEFWTSQGRHLKKSPALNQINKEVSKRLSHDLKSLTHSTGFKFTGRPIKMEKAFNYAMDKAVMNVVSGTFSTQQAVEQVVSELEKSGLRKVDFASGVSRGIDVAAHLAVRTALGQMSADISMSNAEELGADLVEVSSHAGARSGEGHADHAAWQGKVYSISGKSYPKESKRLGYKIEKLSDVTGYPYDPTGLCGYNCRHTFYPFIEGISEPNPIEKDPEPVEVDGKTYTYYQATQKQRRLERELRELKRQHIGGTNRIAAIKAKEQQYARFCRKAGLKQNLNRIYVKGYKRDFAYIKEASLQRSYGQNILKEEIPDSFEPQYISIEEFRQISQECKYVATIEEMTLICGHIDHNGNNRGYFQSRNSFYINEMLRNGAYDVLDDYDKKTVQTLSNLINKVKASKTYYVYRYDGAYVLSGKLKDFAEKARNSKGAVNVNIRYNRGSFTSTSMVEAKNLFKQRPIKWEIKVPEGTNFFTNGVEAESELVLPVDTVLNVLTMKEENGKLIIQAEVVF